MRWWLLKQMWYQYISQLRGAGAWKISCYRAVSREIINAEWRDAPLILSLYTTWTWMVTLTLRPGKETSLPMECEAGLAPGPFWTLLEKSLWPLPGSTLRSFQLSSSSRYRPCYPDYASRNTSETHDFLSKSRLNVFSLCVSVQFYAYMYSPRCRHTQQNIWIYNASNKKKIYLINN
jgi:hypothetical protein